MSNSKVSIGKRIITKIEATRLPINKSGKKQPNQQAGLLTTSNLVDGHFEKYSDKTHWNFSTMKQSLLLLNDKPGIILETGSSAWGTNSSRLFDAYVSNWGGDFYSVDIRIKPLLTLMNNTCNRSHFYCDDSVSFLNKWVKKNPNTKADLVYLDSWDLDTKNPLPCAMHGLSEFFAVQPALQSGSVLVIDDSPSQLEMYPEETREAASKFYLKEGIYPGKGMLVDLYLSKQPKVKKIDHQYQLVYQFL